ncbi:MAG: hypothetical protein JNJ71_03210 [Rubrivivax sp.]|nr:hypothetical protein [Rubrivivax sp.]
MAACGLLLTLVMAGCSSGPPVPDWQLEAHGSMQRFTSAYLAGDSRVAGAEFERARRELARTGRADLVARAELTRCALRLASLETVAAPAAQVCPGFAPLREDASAAERAYADFLSGALLPAQLPLLPVAQQAAAAAGPDATRREAAVRAVADPVARLVASAAALRAGVAPPGLMAQAVDTASQAGWRRPLLAWLGLQRRQALAAGDELAARALQRRIELAGGASPSGDASAAPAAVPAAAPSVGR